jgi:hypothetical protein
MASSCKYGHEVLGCIKNGEFDYLSDCQFPNEEDTPFWMPLIFYPLIG